MLVLWVQQNFAIKPCKVNGETVIWDKVWILSQRVYINKSEIKSAHFTDEEI